MEYGHPVASSDSQKQMEEPRTDVRSVLGDEEEHHEKKPMMTRMRNRMRKMKDSMTKKMHGHVDDHDVHDDDEHSVEAETEHIDDGIQDSLGGKDDPLTLTSRDDRPVTLASRDQDVPLGGLGSRDERPVSLSNREERASLGGLQEPPVAPETIKDIALDADPVDPLRNRSVSRTDDGNIFDPETGNERSVSPDVLSSFRDMDISSDSNILDPETGNERSVSPDVLSSFRDMDISSDDEKKPSYTENPSTTAAGVKEGEEKPSYTEKLPATAVAAKDYHKMAGGTHSGESHGQIATLGSTGPGVEVEAREGDEEEKESYTEDLPATSVAAKDASVSAAPAVYPKMPGGTNSGEAHDQIATPSTVPGVEVEPREGDEEKKGSYTEHPATHVPAKDAAVSAASAVFAKMAGGTHSGEAHDQIATPWSTGTGTDVEVEPRKGDEEEKGSYTENLLATPVAKDAAVSSVYPEMAGGTQSGEAHDQIATPWSTGTGVEVETREGDEEEKGSYTENLSATHVPAKDAAVSAASAMYAKVAGDDQIATPRSTGPGVEVEPREGAEEENGNYTEKLPASVLAAKDVVLPAASAVYANAASGDLSGETHDQIATPVGTGPGVEVEPREGAGEEKESYTETLPATAVTTKDAAVSAASTVFDKVAGGTHSGEAHDQIATPVTTGPGVEVEPREDAEEETGSYTEKLPTTPVAAKDAVVSAASTVYAKVAGDTHSGETHDQISPVSAGPGVEVEPREGAGEKEGTYMEQFTGAAWAVYGKMMGAGTAGDGTEQEISESMKKKGVEEDEVVVDREGEVKGRIVLPEVTAGDIGVNQVVGKEGGGDGGKGMMGMFNRAVNSMVGGDGDGGSGGPAAVADGAGGGAAKERAHE